MSKILLPSLKMLKQIMGGETTPEPPMHCRTTLTMRTIQQQNTVSKIRYLINPLLLTFLSRTPMKIETSRAGHGIETGIIPIIETMKVQLLLPMRLAHGKPMIPAETPVTIEIVQIAEIIMKIELLLLLDSTIIGIKIATGPIMIEARMRIKMIMDGIEAMTVGVGAMIAGGILAQIIPPLPLLPLLPLLLPPLLLLPLLLLLLLPMGINGIIIIPGIMTIIGIGPLTIPLLLPKLVVEV